MDTQLLIQTITSKLKQLPEEKLIRVDDYVEQLMEKPFIPNSKKEFIHSLRGKYKGYLSSSDKFSQQKQREIV